MADMIPIIPRQTVPELSLPLVGGNQLSLQGAPAQKFSLLVFYRGLHCPICRDQLRQFQSRLYDFERLGVRVVAISTDDETRADSTKKQWALDRLDLAYGLTPDQARQWGLYLSSHIGTTSIGVEEPRIFNEPGLFLVKPDRSLYYAAVQSGPFVRPQVHEIIRAIEYVVKNDYPARGEMVSV